MSRIGNKLIEIPDKVKFNVTGEGTVSIEGPKGKLAWTLPKQIKARLEDKNLHLDRSSEARNVKALHGLSRSLISNMVAGVSNGFVKDLEIQGVGFKAAVQGKVLNLNLGFSHPILFSIPEGIKITVTDNTKIKIEGIDKQLVGQAAADIRGYYPPEPYKGKGVRYAGEQIIRKEGKTVHNNHMATTMNAIKLRHTRIRKRVQGTTERPRLAVHFSGKNIYAQVIDDELGKTLVSATTTEKAFKSEKTTRANTATAEKIGKLIAERSKTKSVEKVVFDRGGFMYHGKVKALADAAREGGLKF